MIYKPRNVLEHLPSIYFFGLYPFQVFVYTLPHLFQLAYRIQPVLHLNILVIVPKYQSILEY